MRKCVYKLMAFVLTFSSLMVYFTVPAQAAGLMQSAKVALSDPRSGQPSDYNFTMTTASTGSVKGVKIAFRNDASATQNIPSGSDLWASSLLGATITGLDATGAGWTIDKTDSATGILYIVNADAASINSGTTLTWTMENVSNPGIVNTPTTTGCQQNATNTSSGTCYIRVKTFNTATIATMQNETAGNLLDLVTITYAVNTPITVSATVDPVLTFTVVGLASGNAANGSTTSETATYSTLPFGNITAGTPKYLAQTLAVKTNAVGGYTVTMKMYDDMTGTYAANNVDPYAGSGAVWTDPKAWTIPVSTTKNADSGWIGAHTNNGTVWAGKNPVANFDAGEWGPVNATANLVMRSDVPDDGLAPTQVSYILGVNVYQPSDTYTGYVYYNATPTY